MEGLSLDRPEIFKLKQNSPKIFRALKSAPERKQKMQEFSSFLDDCCAQMYGYGAIFLEEFRQTNCKCVFDIPEHFDINNSLSWGRYHPSTNEIHFGEAALCNKEDFLKVFFHEGIHAIQHQKCASLHPRAVHQDVPFLTLSPHSAIQQMLYIESDAHAKDHVFSYLMQWTKTEDKKDLEIWMKDPKNIENWIREIAKDILKPDFYIDKVLSYYETHIEWFKKEKNIQYASLGKHEIWELGNSLNINSISASADHVPEYAWVEMKQTQEDRLKKINLSLNIEEQEELPKFNALLKQCGVSPEEYIKICKSPDAVSSVDGMV